jgi:hypothetical protein
VLASLRLMPVFSPDTSAHNATEKGQVPSLDPTTKVRERHGPHRPDQGGARGDHARTPAHDGGSAACEVCNMIMMKWVDSAIPLFRAKKSIEDTKRCYFFLGPRSTNRGTASEQQGAVAP